VSSQLPATPREMYKLRAATSRRLGRENLIEL
jgi:hypothetical protein